MDLPEWAAWAGLLFGGTGMTGAIVALARIKPEGEKLRADAAAVLSDQSVKMSTALADRLDRALERIDKLEAAEDAQRQLLQHHHDWDLRVVRELRSRDVEIPDPPPLYLPAAS